MAFYPKKNSDPLLAGELRHRVTFLKRVVTVKSGISKETWEPAFSCWAKIEPLQWREYWAAAALNREHEVRVTIRYRKDFTPAYRLQYGGGTYHIRDVIDPHQRRARLEILAACALPNQEG